MLDNIITKTIIQVVVPLIITLIDNITGDWVENEKLVNILNTGKKYVIILGIVYIILVVRYNLKEHKKRNQEINFDIELKNKQKKINTYNKEISSLTAIFNFTQDSINRLTKVFKSSKKLDLREWDFERIATPVCSGIHEIILSIAEKGTKFSVNIYVKIKQYINGELKEYVKMIAHEGDPKYTPKILGNIKLIKTNSDYLYIKQFINNNPKRTILLEKEEIKRAFKFNGDYENYRDEYNQYVGIPIMCKGNDVISLIEIIAHEDSMISSNKENLENVINEYMLPYQFFLLMSYKIERNMKTTIEIINREDGVNGKC